MSVILFAEVIKCDTSGLGRNSAYHSLTKNRSFSLLHSNYNPFVRTTKHVKFKCPTQRFSPMEEANFNLSIIPPVRALYIHIH